MPQLFAPRQRSSSADSRTKRTPEQCRKDEAGIEDASGAAAAPASGAAAATPPAGGEEPAAIDSGQCERNVVRFDCDAVSRKCVTITLIKLYRFSRF